MFEVLMTSSVRRRKAGGDSIGDALRAMCLAYWKMDELSGTRVDSKGGYDLSVSDAVARVSGIINNAASFDVNNPGLLTRTGINTLDLSTHNYGISAWVKLASKDIFQTFFDITSETSEDQLIQIIWNSFGNSFDITLIDFAVSFPIDADLDTWYHVIGWINKDHPTRYIYLNASGTSDDGGGVSVYEGDLDITIGDSFFHPDSPVNGAIDEIGIFDLGSGDFTQEQIDYLYNSGLGKALY